MTFWRSSRYATYSDSYAIEQYHASHPVSTPNLDREGKKFTYLNLVLVVSVGKERRRKQDSKRGGRMATQILNSIRQALVTRCGVNALRLAASQLYQRDSYSEYRAVLAALGIRISDEDFEVLVESIAESDFPGMLLGALSPRRQLVVDEAFRRLTKIAGRHAVSYAVLRDYFDPSRHADVTSRLKLVEDVIADFHADFGGDSEIDQPEFNAYYMGVSCTIADDLEFEKHVMRSWNLDKPYIASREELASTVTRVPKSTFGRQHPLYQTASQNVGKGLDQAFEVPRENNRAGHFTKHAPPPKPSSSLNTSTTRSKVM